MSNFTNNHHQAESTSTPVLSHNKLGLLIEWVKNNINIYSSDNNSKN
jgi:hypothetical protein